MSQEKKPVILLWTGGWDSTFRLIHLLVKQKRPVQPHYLIDADRRSTSEELLVRDKIIARLFERYPETKRLLCPSVIFDRTEIPEMPDVTAAYQRLRARVPIGSQYEWMATYCLMQGINEVETCIHTGGTANKLLDPIAQRTDEGIDHYYSIPDQYKDMDEYKVFGCYHFPLYDVRKVDMGREATENGWQDMMKLTWFCLRPLPDRTPCGMCHPCGMVMKEGMTWRLPLKSRMLYYLTLQPLAHSGSKFYTTARQIKRLIIPSRAASKAH